MSKVNFYLKDTNVNQDTPINIVFVYNKQRLKYATGKRIEPKFWDCKKQRAKTTPKFPFSHEFNLELHGWEQQVMNIYKRYIEVKKCYPSKDEFREELDIYKGVKLPTEIIKNKKTSLYDFFGIFIKEKSFKIKKKNNSYMFLLGHLKAYQKSRKKKSFDFEDVTMDFFLDFVNEYLYKENQFKNNYASKLISVFKTVLKEAFNRGLHTNTIYTNRNFHVSEVAVDNIYLSEAELSIFYEFDLSKNERLERVRDLFIIGCYTGLRFSDFTSLKQEHFSIIDGKEIITITTQKTGERVCIPAHRFVKEILKKYNGNIPKAITNQKMNEFLKEIGQLIGFDTSIIKIEYEAGKRNENVYKKFDLISTHTARRSFATNAHKSGMDAFSIMKITGHTSEKQFNKYIKITGEESAVKMAKHTFFN